MPSARDKPRAGRQDPAARPAEASAVLRKAIFRAAQALSFSQKDVASLTGLSESTVTRLSQGSFVLEPASKSGELALLFLRIYRGLNALVGGDDAKARAWFHAENDHVGGVPAKRVMTVEGLTDVARYLDAMRGRL